MRNRLLLLICVFLTSLPSAAAFSDEPDGAGWRPMAMLSIGSRHFGADRRFQEFNPGVALGAARGDLWPGVSLGAELGVFRNSYDRRSAFAIVSAERRLASLGEGDFWLGGFFGYAEYPNLVATARDFGAIPIGDFIPVIGGQASFRSADDWLIRARFGPGVRDSDLIVGLQLGRIF